MRLGAAWSGLSRYWCITRQHDQSEIEGRSDLASCLFFQGEAGVASAANKGFMSNAGFVVTGSGVVVYDALATPVLGEAMIEEIRRITPEPIKKVIVGHYHADHIYGLQAFKRVGAEIIAHEAGRAYLNSDLAEQRLAQRRADLFPWVDENTRLIAADTWLSFDQTKTQQFTLGRCIFA